VDVHQRHQVVGVAVVCLAGLFSISSAASQDKLPSAAGMDQSCAKEPAFAPDDPKPTRGCKSDVDKNDSLLRRGRENKETGLVYFRIGYDQAVDDLQKQAFRVAMAMWNKHSRITGFVFDETPGKPDFRLTEGAPRQFSDWAEMEKKQCAGYMSHGSYIWYSPPLMNWVTRDEHIASAAAVYAHELGHALNICHKSGSCLMRDGHPNETCLDRGASSSLDIPADDLRDAYVCGHGARGKARKEDEQLKLQKNQKSF
jgi:hypothetical protein